MSTTWDFSLLRTTINSLLPYFDSMAMVFNSSNLTNISSIQGIFRSGGVNSSLTQIYKTSAWPPTASSTTLQTKIGATWSKLVEDLGAGCGRWGWVAGVWLLVCCVLGAACWVLLHVLPCLPLKSGDHDASVLWLAGCALCPLLGGWSCWIIKLPYTRTEPRSVPQNRTGGWQGDLVVKINHLALHHIHKTQHMHTSTTLAWLENQSVEVPRTHTSTFAQSNTHTAH